MHWRNPKYNLERVSYMAQYFNTVSRTFNEYLLIPNLTTSECTPDKVSLKTPLVRFKVGETPSLTANIPLVSACMQSVSGDQMGIALAREGGVAFIYMSQPIQEQVAMVRKVKNFKAGFVKSKWNLKPIDILQDILRIKNETTSSTIPITEDGTYNGKLLGLITSKDYRVSRDSVETQVSKLMTPIDKLVYATKGISLSEANDLIWEHKINCLPVVDGEGNLCSLVFRKDYENHRDNPLALYDSQQRYFVGAGVNTRDYRERIPALVEAGVDLLCIDSSDGYTIWQKDVIEYVRQIYGDKVKIGAGNVVDKEAFYYLADAGADFVKIGIGGGSICTTREVKGIGRGQATAVIEVAEARDEYAKYTGEYVPLCSDGSIVHNYHIALALAMGANFVMMGRYFAMLEESPPPKVKVGNDIMKQHWGESIDRAKNWARYDLGEEGKTTLSFPEGVDAYVPYAGSCKENVALTISMVKSTMSNCGSASIQEFQEKARINLVSSVGITEGGAHDLVVRE